jgi:Uma2 family endonuclease
LTVADLDTMPEDGNRYEIIGGELFVSRAPSITHQRVVHNLQMGIGPYLIDNPIGILVPGPGVAFDDFSSVIPDLVFVSEARRGSVASGDRLTGAPDLAIEVLSPGAANEGRDRKVKRRLYGQYGVTEYWIVDLINRSVEIYGLREGSLELIATLYEQDELTSLVLPELRLNVSDIFRL